MTPVLYEAGDKATCHYCDEEKPTKGGAAIAGYLGIVVWYCADCYLSVLGKTNG